MKMKRVLLKLSGEMLAGGNKSGFDEATVKEVAMQVKAGQVVIYSKYAGTEVKLDGEEYIIVKQNDVIAVVE